MGDNYKIVPSFHVAGKSERAARSRRSRRQPNFLLQRGVRHTDANKCSRACMAKQRRAFVSMRQRRNTGDDAALRLLLESEGALCTIASIDGSFSRSVGAQLAVTWTGEMAGSLSDGCLEHELATQAVRARGGEPRTLRYGAGSSVIDFRLPCGAGLDIVLDPSPDRSAISLVCAALDERKPGLLTIPSAAPLSSAERAYMPPLRLLLLGSGPELAQLAVLAKSIGADVACRAPGEGIALHHAPTGLEADPWSAIILLFHDHEWEEEILAWALTTPAFYIGSIGGEIMRMQRKVRLRARGADERSIARIRGPIGLIPSARDPDTLALSILSEVALEYERLRRSEPALVWRTKAVEGAGV